MTLGLRVDAHAHAATVGDGLAHRGSVLLAIHHGDAILGGHRHPALAWKAPLTYLVPFVVAGWGALLNGRVR